MAKLNENISNLIDAQVPSFVGENHPKFVDFLKAYYEWLEDSELGGTVYYNKKLKDLFDLDDSEFNELITKSKLPFIPIDPKNPTSPPRTPGPQGPQGPQGTESSQKANTIIRDDGTLQFAYDNCGSVSLDRTKLAKQINALRTQPNLSYAFLFRSLYNTGVDLYSPRDDILKASHGKWILPQAVRLTASNTLFAIDTTLLRGRALTGDKSKASRIIEGAYKTIDRDSGRQILEIFISSRDEEKNRPFFAGETVSMTYVDGDNNTITIREELIGSIYDLKIDPNRRGTKYRGLEIDPDTNAISYPGDPVVFYGGLAKTPDAIKAEAYVKNVSTGGIETVDLIDAGLGYRTFTGTFVTTLTPTEGHGANIFVRAVDTDNAVTLSLNTDTIGFKKDLELQDADFGFVNVGVSTIDTVLGTAFSFSDVEVAPLKVVTVRQGGSGYTGPPEIEFETFYASDLVADEDVMISIDTTPLAGPNTRSLYLSTSPVEYYEGSYVLIVQKNSRATREMRKIVQAIAQENGSVLIVVDRAFSALITENVKVYVENRPRMKDLGQIANVKIISGGTGYSVNDLILFNSSTSIGYGANAHVSAVGGLGDITEITVTERGEGYYAAPNVSVQTITGANAILIAGILSNNEIANTSVDDNGVIDDFRIVQRGFDYIATPNVSLKVKDIYVNPSDTIDKIIVSGERVWQNTGSTIDFTALVDSYDETNAMLRLYNYAGTLNVQNTFTTANIRSDSNVTFNVAQYPNGTYKVITYGDGRAKANAFFANGVIQYDGYFFNSDGFLSSGKRLQGPRKYHDYSYVISVDKQLDNYRNVVLNTLHPAGQILFGQYNIDKRIDVLSEEQTLNVVSIAPVVGSVSVAADSSLLEGVGTSFLSTANANDIVVIDAGNGFREQSKYITSVLTDTSLTLESDLSFVGFGRANVTTDSNVVTIFGTTTKLSSFLKVGDLISVNVANTQNVDDTIIIATQIENINDVTRRITCDTEFTSLNGNSKLYIVSPTYSEVNYKIIPGA
jgi:hypothetical protein